MPQGERNSRLVKHRQRIGLPNQFGVQVQVIIQAAVGFGVVNPLSHQQISGVVVALRLDEAAVEGRQVGIGCFQGGGQELKFLTTPAFDETATNQMIDDLGTLTIADGFHQSGDPGAGIGLAERNPAPLEQIQDKLEVLQFLNGDRIQFFDARE